MKYKELFDLIVKNCGSPDAGGMAISDWLEAHTQSMITRCGDVIGAIECLNGNDYSGAREKFRIKDDWLYTGYGIHGTRDALKNLLAGLLDYHAASAKENHRQILQRWASRVELRNPDLRWARFGVIHFHLFAVYGRLIESCGHPSFVKEFATFLHHYIYLMALNLAEVILSDVDQHLEELSTLPPGKTTDLQTNDLRKGVAMNRQRLQEVASVHSHAGRQPEIRTVFQPQETFSLESGPGRRVVLEGRQHMAIPSTVLQNQEVEELFIIDTQIDRIGPEIGELTNLRRFHFSGSKLEEVSNEIYKLPKITSIDIIDPCFIPEPIIMEGLATFMEQNHDRLFGPETLELVSMRWKEQT